MQCEEVLSRLRSLTSLENVAGMARFGISPSNTLGISVNTLRKLAKEVGRDHTLAQELWASAVHDKKAADDVFLSLLPLIKREATDERNFVKKAVNWAMRQIGKRNRRLNAAAIQTAQAVRQLDSRAARWIAADALRELTGAAVQARLSL